MNSLKSFNLLRFSSLTHFNATGLFLYPLNSFMKEAVIIQKLVLQICRANQWTGFYMITASVMKKFNLSFPDVFRGYRKSPVINLNKYNSIITQLVHRLPQRIHMGRKFWLEFLEVLTRRYFLNKLL